MNLKKITSFTLKTLPLIFAFNLVACTASTTIDAKKFEEYQSKFHEPLTLSNTPRSEISYNEDASTWGDFKNFLIQEAKKQGFSNRIIKELEDLNFNAKVIRIDQNQYERILENRRKNSDNKTPIPENKELDLMEKYVNSHISDYKIQRAQALMQNYDYYLTQYSKKFSVPKEVIIGLWGMETNFGKYTGSYDLLDSLASLAYEGRRRLFFTREFFNALRVMEINNFSKKEMLSSWAGAVGQIQFMPTSYLKYAVDGNGDKQVNIWLSPADSLASIASYLHTEGWNDKLPWGLPLEGVDYSRYLANKDLEGVDKSERTLKEWESLGYKLAPQAYNYANFKNVNKDTLFWLVIPTNEPKQAHLVTNNYNVYMHWNRSMYFAFANGTFANDIYLLNQEKQKGKK